MQIPTEPTVMAAYLDAIASEVVKQPVARKKMLAIFERQQLAALFYTKECLEADIPSVLSLPAGVRADALRIMAVIKLAVVDKKHLCEDIAQILREYFPAVHEYIACCVKKAPCKYEVAVRELAIGLFLGWMRESTAEEEAVLVLLRGEFERAFIHSNQDSVLDLTARKVKNVPNFYAKSFCELTANWRRREEQFISGQRADEFFNPLESCTYAAGRAGYRMDFAIRSTVISKRINENCKRASCCGLPKKPQNEAMISVVSDITVDTAYTTSVVVYILASRLVAEMKGQIRLEIEAPYITDYSKEGSSILAEVQQQLDAARHENSLLKEALASTQKKLAGAVKREGVWRARVAGAEKVIDELSENNPVSLAKSDEAAAGKKPRPDATWEAVKNHRVQRAPSTEDIQISNQIALKPYLAVLKVVVVGGHSGLLTKLRSRFPEIQTIDESRLASCEAVIRGADVILAKTNSISHKLYSKSKQVAKAAGVPFRHLPPVSSLELLEMAIVESLISISPQAKGAHCIEQ